MQRLRIAMRVIYVMFKKMVNVSCDLQLVNSGFDSVCVVAGAMFRPWLKESIAMAHAPTVHALQVSTMKRARAHTIVPPFTQLQVSNMKNANTREELEEIKLQVLQHLSALPPVPSAQMAHRPPLRTRGDLPEEDMDARGGGQLHDEARRARPGDDSDDEVCAYACVGVCGVCLVCLGRICTCVGA